MGFWLLPFWFLFSWLAFACTLVCTVPRIFLAGSRPTICFSGLTFFRPFLVLQITNCSHINSIESTDMRYITYRCFWTMSLVSFSLSLASKRLQGETRRDSFVWQTKNTLLLLSRLVYTAASLLLSSFPCLSKEAMKSSTDQTRLHSTWPFSKLALRQLRDFWMPFATTCFEHLTLTKSCRGSPTILAWRRCASKQNKWRLFSLPLRTHRFSKRKPSVPSLLIIDTRWLCPPSNLFLLIDRNLIFTESAYPWISSNNS